MLILILFLVASLIGCASNQPLSQSIQLAEFLSSASCASGEFRGSGIGKSEDEALSIARSDLAMHINSSLKVSTKLIQSQQVFNGNENLSSEYESKIVMQANLQNAQDAYVLRVERSAGEVGAIVCMSRADAAKGFLEQQRLVLDSMVLASNTALNTEHPKHKNEAWQRTQMYHNNIVAIQNLLNGWGVAKADYFDKANEIYSKTREDYKNYCVDVKLHWNPEKKSNYSDIAFERLSKNLKMEKSPCQGSGISLNYKSSEPECLIKFGVNTCSCTQSLSVAACDGTEYTQLKSNEMEAHQKLDFALEKLQKSLKSAEFWNQWIQEIKQWNPQCE